MNALDARYRPGRGPLHRMAPSCKVAALVGFVAAVATTPRQAVWALALDGAVVLTLAAVAGLRPATLARALTIELPFVAFAVLLPVIAGGPRTSVVGLHLSVEGLWSAWNIGAKATIGVTAATVLAATTPVGDLLGGLERLRLPRRPVAIAGLMVRYLDVTTDEARRMSIARRSRGDDPRWLWQARGLASSAGTLFIRSYERGERVRLAMVSRGWDGGFPTDDAPPAPRADRVRAGAVIAIAVLASLAAWTVAR